MPFRAPDFKASLSGLQNKAGLYLCINVEAVVKLLLHTVLTLLLMQSPTLEERLNLVTVRELL